MSNQTTKEYDRWRSTVDLEIAPIINRKFYPLLTAEIVANFDRTYLIANQKYFEMWTKEIIRPLNETYGEFVLPPYQMNQIEDYEKLNQIILPIELKYYLSQISKNTGILSNNPCVFNLYDLDYDNDPFEKYKERKSHNVYGRGKYFVSYDHPLAYKFKIDQELNQNVDIGQKFVVREAEYDYHQIRYWEKYETSDYLIREKELNSAPDPKDYEIEEYNYQAVANKACSDCRRQLFDEVYYKCDECIWHNLCQKCYQNSMHKMSRYHRRHIAQGKYIHRYYTYNHCRHVIDQQYCYCWNHHEYMCLNCYMNVSTKLTKNYLPVRSICSIRCINQYHAILPYKNNLKSSESESQDAISQDYSELYEKYLISYQLKRELFDQCQNKKNQVYVAYIFEQFGVTSTISDGNVTQSRPLKPLEKIKTIDYLMDLGFEIDYTDNNLKFQTESYCGMKIVNQKGCGETDDIILAGPYRGQIRMFIGDGSGDAWYFYADNFFTYLLKGTHTHYPLATNAICDGNPEHEMTLDTTYKCRLCNDYDLCLECYLNESVEHWHDRYYFDCAGIPSKPDA